MEEKKVRCMTIIMDANDENNITILSDNLEGSSTFYEDEVAFLEKVLKNVKEKSQNTRNNFSSFSAFSSF